MSSVVEQDIRLLDPRQELQPWAFRQFERAYREANRRGRCSRGDFYAGYRAALLDLKARSQFKTNPAEDQ
jgi:hypothetical protein